MKDTNGERIFYGINYFVLLLVGLTCLFPLVHILAISLSEAQDVASGRVFLWPVDITIKPYQALFAGSDIINGFKNNLIITVVGTVLSMIFTVMAAYPLSRKNMIGRRKFTLIILFTMLFTGGIIPNYLVLSSFHLINSYWAIWLPGLISVFNLLVLKTYFESLPEELIEAARMDGCKEFRLIVQIVLPLSVPVLAALTLFYLVGYWNQFVNVLLFINDTEKYNLTVIVQQMIRSQSVIQELNNLQPEDTLSLTPETIRASGLVVSILPMIIIYPILQRYFVKGITLGAIKG